MIFGGFDGGGGGQDNQMATSALDPTPTNTPTPAGQGCTPGFWKNHLAAWPAGYSPNQLVSTYFDLSSVPTNCQAFDKNTLTLLQALSLQGGKSPCGAIETLLRAAVSALLTQAIWAATIR